MNAMDCEITVFPRAKESRDSASITLTLAKKLLDVLKESDADELEYASALTIALELVRGWPTLRKNGL